MTIDLNCDLGEYSEFNRFTNDEKIMPWITSANIACGLHAGDPATIEKSVLLAIRHGVAIGAHPGFPDRRNFGRATMNLSIDELTKSLLLQIEAVRFYTEKHGQKLHHIKPHGALYNMASTDPELARLIAGVISSVDKSLILYGLSGSEMKQAALQAGLAFASEVFADREYTDKGILLPRSEQGAVIHDTEKIILRAVGMVNEKCVKAASGKIIPLDAHTICIHGDNPIAPELARKMAVAFRQNGIELKSCS
jgi:5-oxoprolinase (ATP-hydrolysing) subunit A